MRSNTPITRVSIDIKTGEEGGFISTKPQPQRSLKTTEESLIFGEQNQYCYIIISPYFFAFGLYKLYNSLAATLNLIIVGLVA